MRGRREAETERQETGEMRDSWKEETERRVELGGGGQAEMGIRKQGERETGWGEGRWQRRRAKQKT